MCKRYYVEVSDLDAEHGREQLQQAGIANDHILVIDTDEDCIVSAIRQATGAGLDEIRSQSRERTAVAARTMYVHYCLLRGDSIGRICEAIGKTRNRIRYYAADYEPKAFGDREFRLSTDTVQTLLNADPRWRPAKFERPSTGKKRRRKQGKKRSKAPAQHREPTPSTQLEIQW